MSKTTTWLGECDKGEYGTPGDCYFKHWAGVRRVGGGFEVKLVYAYGSNQGYLEEHRREERRYRAGSLIEVLEETLAGLNAEGDDSVFSIPQFPAAVREAVYEAEDALRPADPDGWELVARLQGDEDRCEFEVDGERLLLTHDDCPAVYRRTD